MSSDVLHPNIFGIIRAYMINSLADASRNKVMEALGAAATMGFPSATAHNGEKQAIAQG